MSRKAAITRRTAETNISLEIDLDGKGQADLTTDIGFFDHMLAQIARHGCFDLQIEAQGDLEVDAHHTIEDVGICFGMAVAEALGDCRGIARYGHALVPMDEALTEIAVDVSGRPKLVYIADMGKGSIGAFDVELVEEFFQAFVNNARLALHVELRRGENLHHCVESIFKAAGRALHAAFKLDTSMNEIPSTKGIIEV